MTEHPLPAGRASQTRWLLSFGRPVLWPLLISIACRVAELAAGRHCWDTPPTRRCRR